LKPTLVIGLDGALWPVLDRAMAQGRMPCLAGLLRDAPPLTLRSTVPPLTSVAWSVFLTGRGPGELGVPHYAYLEPSANRVVLVDGSSLRPTFLEVCDRAGLRTAAVSVPMTYPPPRLSRGCIIAGIRAPGDRAAYTWPPSLKGELLAEVPGYRLPWQPRAAQGTDPRAASAAYLEAVRGQVDAREAACEFLLGKARFDLFFVHFQALDLAQHVLWGYLDREHPSYDAGVEALIFERLYRRVDDAMRRVRDRFGESAGAAFSTIVASDHGFERHVGAFQLGNWLREGGYLVTGRHRLRRRLSGAAWRLARHISRVAPGALMPGPLRRVLRRRARRLPIGQDVDWRRSAAFALGRGTEGCLYLVCPEAKRAAVAERLVGGLASVEDPFTAQPVVEDVLRRDEVYSGRHVERMPHLVVKMRRGYTCTGEPTADGSLLRRIPAPPDVGSGKHSYEGILLCHGLGVPAPDSELNIRDVAGLVLRNLGVGDAERGEARGAAGGEGSGRAPAEADEEAEEVLARLRSMGYM
jgi:predicted AlkP superfamily phosphohydrolase/phosphomutase